MRVLVTGAGGMLGQDVVVAAEAAGHDVLAYSHGELDITDAAAVEHALTSARPTVVVNCAAWTDVDAAETNVEAARATNATGAGRVARAAASLCARLLHVSTDYVFDGRAGRPYVESDATNPLSAYGRDKLAGEREVAAAGGRHLIVRSSWLFGAGGKNFVATMLRLATERDDVAVVTDQVGCPTWTVHLAGALVKLASGEADGVMHVAGGGSCSWYELAVETFRQAGVSCRVSPTTTSVMSRPAPRPAWSVLRSERADAVRLADWREGVAGYLAQLRDGEAGAALDPAAEASA